MCTASRPDACLRGEAVVLRLQSNELTVIPTGMALASLKYLDVSSNQIGSLLPDTFGKMEDLEVSSALPFVPWEIAQHVSAPRANQPVRPQRSICSISVVWWSSCAHARVCVYTRVARGCVAFFTPPVRAQGRPFPCRCVVHSDTTALGVLLLESQRHPHLPVIQLPPLPCLSLASPRAGAALARQQIDYDRRGYVQR